MIVIQANPRIIPPGRNYVVTPNRLSHSIENYDFKPLFLHASINEWSFLLLEWDIAIADHSIEKLERKVKKAPHRIHSVPYQVLSGDELVWVNTDKDWRWVKYGTQRSAHFGFGCTYFPFQSYSHWLPNPIDPRLTDTNFSEWYFQENGETPIHWDIPIVHLNI